MKLLTSTKGCTFSALVLTSLLVLLQYTEVTEARITANGARALAPEEGSTETSSSRKTEEIKMKEKKAKKSKKPKKAKKNDTGDVSTDIITTSLCLDVDD